MGVHLTENDLSELEPQISKIFKKQLGFFDSDILSTTMKIILNGTDLVSLEQRMMSLMDGKKAKRAAEEVKMSMSMSLRNLNNKWHCRSGRSCPSSTS